MSKEKKQDSIAPAFIALLEQDSKKQASLPCSMPDLNESVDKRTLGQEFYNLVTSVKLGIIQPKRNKMFTRQGKEAETDERYPTSTMVGKH